MDTTPIQIIRLLRQDPRKPGELSPLLGISRQALHRHLLILVREKRIRKHGSGPHVTYSVLSPDEATSRVREDYEHCEKTLLPKYLHAYNDLLEKYMRTLTIKRTGSVRAKVNLGFLVDSAAVYSSNIEGNTLNLNSFLNSRMSPRVHRPKEAREIEDLVSAYGYTKKSPLDEKNMLHAHAMLSREFVSPSRQGVYRREPVGVFSRQGLEYMAVEWHLAGGEMQELFRLISALLRAKQTPAERFFWATWLHLMIALIHPFADGNGRTARLCEKWFLAQTLGAQMFALPSEECYWKRRPKYYRALKIGVNYWEADMQNAFTFFTLLPESVK